MKGDTIKMTKKNKKIIEKAIRTIAEKTGESPSMFCFYEPEVPKKLIKSDSTK